MKIHTLDVRSSAEYENGYIEDVINLPIDELLNRSEYALSILKY